MKKFYSLLPMLMALVCVEVYSQENTLSKKENEEIDSVSKQEIDDNRAELILEDYQREKTKNQLNSLEEQYRQSKEDYRDAKSEMRDAKRALKAEKKAQKMRGRADRLARKSAD